ncbi:hypothetical protein GOODEAATRI_018461, partial [Goodea atripinnis]
SSIFAKFTIDGHSGILRVKPGETLDYETTPTHFVTVVAKVKILFHHFVCSSLQLLAVEIDTPERFSATADILINLLDTNDNVPIFTSEYYIARVPENSPGGSSVVAVTVSPLLIKICLIITQPWTSLDAEMRSKYNFYVKAEDSEGKYSIAEVFAVDDDAESPNNVIEYSIMTADPDNAFDINADTGEIQLKPFIKSMEIVQNITKQKDCKWSLVVQARDRGSPSFSTTAVINIDITEAIQLERICALLQTPLKGPMAAFLMKSRDNPLRALGIVTFIILVLVGVTVLISTVMYMRNSKSNRIMPVRRIIKRGPRDQQTWKFKIPVIKLSSPAEKFLISDPVSSPPQETSSPRLKPIPPIAPCLPPPPPSNIRANERPRAVPTISGALTSRSSKKAKPGRRKEGNISSALVSELKMKLEQKINENNQGYY